MRYCKTCFFPDTQPAIKMMIMVYVNFTINRPFILNFCKISLPGFICYSRIARIEYFFRKIIE